MTRLFTGWHMTAIIVTFFGVVIAVNVLMATLATTTFSGTVVDNSYVASQEFNTWLAESRAQKALGWSVRVDLDSARHTRVVGHIPAGAVVAGVALHPIGRVPDQALSFVQTGNGVYLSRAAIPAGRFRIRIKVRSGGHVADFEDEVPA